MIAFRWRLVLALVASASAAGVSWFLHFIEHPQCAAVEPQSFPAFNAAFERWSGPVVIAARALTAALALWLAFALCAGVLVASVALFGPNISN